MQTNAFLCIFRISHKHVCCLCDSKYEKIYIHEPSDTVKMKIWMILNQMLCWFLKFDSYFYCQLPIQLFHFLMEKWAYEPSLINWDSFCDSALHLPLDCVDVCLTRCFPFEQSEDEISPKKIISFTKIHPLIFVINSKEKTETNTQAWRNILVTLKITPPHSARLVKKKMLVKKRISKRRKQCIVWKFIHWFFKENKQVANTRKR